MSSSEDIRRAGDMLLTAVEEMKATNRRAERMVSLLERIAPDLHDLRLDVETVIQEWRSDQRITNERLAVLEDAATDTKRAANEASAQAFATREATGRVQLTAPAGGDKSGPVKAIGNALGQVVRAPATKILALAVLMFALAAGAVGAVLILQEVRAVKARLGGKS